MPFLACIGVNVLFCAIDKRTDWFPVSCGGGVSHYCASTMYKFIIPLFALAFLLVSCTSHSDRHDESNVIILFHRSLGRTHWYEVRQQDPLRHAHGGPPDLQGNITVELNADAAPKTVTNFVWLSNWASTTASPSTA